MNKVVRRGTRTSAWAYGLGPRRVSWRERWRYRLAGPARRRWARGLVALLVALGGCSLAAAPDGPRPDPARWYRLWGSYQQRFVDPQGRVIDWSEGGVTTSEAQSYALFFALVADDRGLFQKILHWTEANLAQGSLARHLPAWRWGRRPNGSWGILDHNSAADADLWLAYTLIQAGRLWGRADYTATGILLARRIAREEVTTVPGLGPMLLPGKHGFRVTHDTYVFNPSYLPLPVVAGMAHAIPRGPWAAIARTLPVFLRATSPHGFAPDWVAYTPGRGYHAAPQGSVGSYNAIRVYLWAGIGNPDTPGARRILEYVSGMGRYLHDHLLPPERVDVATGAPAATGPVGFSAALIPYLIRAGHGRASRNQRLRLRADYDKATGLYGKPAHYYDENLALFALGWVYGTIRFSAQGALVPVWSKDGAPLSRA